MLKAGQVLYDNDPRHRGRKVEVIRIEVSYAVCLSGPRQVKVRLDYSFSDGKPRRSGYSTVAALLASRSCDLDSRTTIRIPPLSGDAPAPVPTAAGRTLWQKQAHLEGLLSPFTEISLHSTG